MLLIPGVMRTSYGNAVATRRDRATVTAVDATDALQAAPRVKSVSRRVERRSITIEIGTSIPAHQLDRAEYHWYIDAVYAGSTRAPRKTFYVEYSAQLRIDVRPTRYGSSYDPLRCPPRHRTARRAVQFGPAAGAASYKIQIATTSNPVEADWTTVRTLKHDGRAVYRVNTEPLADDERVAVRVLPVDAAGNDGTAVVFERRRVVRTPDVVATELTFRSDGARIALRERDE